MYLIGTIEAYIPLLCTSNSKTDTPDQGKDPGSMKIEAFSQSFDDFVPILGNDGKRFWIIRVSRPIFNVNRTG